MIRLTALVISAAVAAAPPPAALMTIRDMAFVPLSVPLRAGQTLIVVNNDPFEHTATVKGGFDLDLKPGQRRSVVLTHSGSFEVTCRYHPTMKTRIVVLPRKPKPRS